MTATHQEKIPLPIVGFTGFQESGKTTAAKWVAHQFGWRRMPMAGPLKTMLCALGLDNRDINGDRKTAPNDLLCGKTPRHAMQTLGTEWGRNCIGPDIWVNAWKLKLRNWYGLDMVKGVVCDDIRFPNEVEAVKSMGGIVIRIDRPGKRGDGHASEQIDTLSVDHVVLNGPELTVFYERVGDCVGRWVREYHARKKNG